MTMKECAAPLFILLLLAAAPALMAEEDIPLPGDETNIPLPGETRTATPGSKAVTLRGYVENTTTVEYLEATEKETLLNATRARLNLGGRPSKNIDYGIGLAGLLYAGACEYDLTAYLPAPDAATVAVPPLFAMNLENSIYLQEAFVTLYLPHLRIRAGRHKFYTGTGYAYNPTDLFNRKNPLDPTYETDGIDALLVALELPKNFEIQGLIHINDSFRKAGYMGRLKGHILGWDMALQYTHAVRKRYDYSSLNTMAGLLPAETDPGYAAAYIALAETAPNYYRSFRWHFAGGELSGEILGINFNAEGGYAWIEATGNQGTLDRAGKNHERFLVGFDYTFPFQLYVMAEYLRIGQAASNKETITLNDRLAYYSGETLALTRDTIFSGITYPFTDLMDGALYCIAGINDGSVIINPRIDWSIFPAAKLIISVYVPLGSEKSQVGRSSVSGFIRVKINF